MASNVNKIQLFSKNLLKNMQTCSEPFLMQLHLLSITTWLDNSLLKELVAASKNKAASELIIKFDSLINDSLPITSYPVPVPTQLIIPLEDSDYTVVATKHNRSLAETTLKQIKYIKMLLVHQWEITEHAIQLLALYTELGYLYWLIPKAVTQLVRQCEIQRELLKEGIILISIFPETFFTSEHDEAVHKLFVGPFSFLVSCLQDNIVVIICFKVIQLMHTFICIYVCTMYMCIMEKYFCSYGSNCFMLIS